MRLWQKIAIPMILVAALAAGFAEFVLDIRTPKSDLQAVHSIRSSSTFRMADLDRRSDEMKKVHGPNADTMIGPDAGHIEVKSDGKVVETGYMRGRFAGVTGLIAVGSRELTAAIFPFDFGPNHKPSDSRHTLTGELKARLRNVPAARQFLKFEMADWDIGDCANPEAGEIGLGSYAALMGFQKGAACIFLWKGRRPASMLININVAEGNPLLWPFVPWLCRVLTTAALDRAVSSGKPPPDYATCILVDRANPERSNGRYSTRIYEVREGRKLLLIRG